MCVRACVCAGRLTTQCFEKCVHSIHDGDLHVGEMACVDRCVMKYLQVQTKVGEQMAKLNQAQANAQQAAAQGAPPS